MKLLKFLLNIRIRLFLTYLILIVFNISLMGSLFYVFTERHFISSRKDYLSSASNYFLEFISPNIKTSEDLAGAARFFIRQYWEHMDYDFVVVDTNGEIVADSRSIDARMGVYPSESDSIEDVRVKQVLKDGKTVSWLENVYGSQYIYQCNPIYLGNKIIGAVKFTMSMDDFSELFTVLKNYFFTTFIWSLIAALLLALIFIRTFMKPILRARNVAREITTGNLNVRVDYNVSDELGDLSKAINKMAESLKMLEQTRNLFLANVSHELRTPLTIIKGFAVTMLGEPDISESNKHCLEIIDKETDRLTRLVNELLQLSRIRTGRFYLKLSKSSIKNIIEFVVFQMSAKAKELNCTLNISHSENVPDIYLDPDRIKEVVINLVDNALKYSTGSSGESIVDINYVTEGEYIKITITDNGPGISEEDAALLFERFFRGGSRAQKVEGIGLGLAITKEIVEAHNGKISVESPESGGCRFIVSLPVNLD